MFWFTFCGGYLLGALTVVLLGMLLVWKDGSKRNNEGRITLDPKELPHLDDICLRCGTHALEHSLDQMNEWRLAKRPNLSSYWLCHTCVKELEI